MPKIVGQVVIDGVAYDATADFSTLVQFSDFNATTKSGLVLPNVLNGNGNVYQMRPMTSTVAAIVNALVVPQTNPYRLLNVGGGDSAHVVTGIDLSNFVLQGTSQGHNYNGLMVGYSTGAHLYDLSIFAIPGDSGAPPGETFSLNLWHANTSLIERVHIDGKGIAASLFGLNNTIGVTVRNSSGNNSRAGTSLTSYKCGNVVVQDYDARYCQRPFNIERAAGDHTYTRCDMRNAVNRPHITCNTDGPADGLPASVKVTIIDPIVDAFPVRVGVLVPATGVNATYMGSPQTQKPSDVSLIINGVNVSSDPTKLLCGNVW